MKPNRSRGPSLWRRGLRTISAATVAALAIGAGTALGATAAQAVPNAAISLIPLANASTPHGQFDPYQYNVDFSCSGASGAGCTGMQIRVPVTLDPRSDQVELFDRWSMSAQLSAASNGAFTQAWEQSGNTRTLVLTARNTIAAGVQESLALLIQPPNWVGDDVKFTVGGAQLTTTNGDPATSNSHTATVTNIPLNQPTLQMTGGYVPSQTSNLQIVNYAFDPMINNIITQSGATHVFGTGDVHTSATPNVTAQYETIELSVEIPPGGRVHNPGGSGWNSTPGPGSGTGGSATPSYETVVNGNTWTFIIPANRIPTDLIRFTVEYPASMAGETVNLTANRTFVASNGDRHDDDVTLRHVLDMRPIPNGDIGKCGHGGIAMAGVQLVGMCSSSVMVPSEWTSRAVANAPATGRYVLKMSEMLAGDTVSFTDFMPCFDRPGSSVLIESFESQELCPNPTVEITGVTAGVEPKNSSSLQNITSGVTYTVTNNDGTITSPVYHVTDPFPARPASGYWTRIDLTIENFPQAGNAIGTVHVRALPGVDREMVLENYVSGVVTRAANGEVKTYATSPVGVIRVMDITTATVRSNIGYSAGSSFATVSGSYTMHRLDPGVALPVHTLQLPAGFDTQNGNLASYTVQYDGTGMSYALTDHYNVTIVPEDSATNTGPRLVMTPIPGTLAVPTNGDGWRAVTVQGRITPTWGQWNSRQIVTAAISIDGDAHAITACTGAATRVGADLIDRDNDGVTDTDSSCEASTSALLGIPNAAATAIATKGVRNSGETSWTTGTTPVAVTSGSMEYLINWRNAGQPELTDVVLYDLLPVVGDTGATTVTAGQSRGSTYTPTFTGIVGATPVGIEVAYSASENPCRPEILPNNPGCDNDWSANTADLGGNEHVTALRVTLQGRQTAGSSHSLVFGMDVPPTAVAGDVAWNTVAHRALLAGQPMSPAESARVGAVVPSNVKLNKTAATNHYDDWEFSVGDTITYTIEAFNEFGAGVENVVLHDDLSEVLGYADFNNDAQASSGVVEFDEVTKTLQWVGDLGPLETATITYSVTATAPSPVYLTNTVTGTANEEQTNCTSGDEFGCWVTVNFNGAPSISIDKVSTNVTEGTPVLSGGLVSWDYNVTNTGNEDLRLTSLTDSRGVVVTCPLRELPVGESMTCTGQGHVAGDPSYTNVGTVRAVGVDSDRTVTDSDAWSTPIEQISAGLEVTKVAVGIEEGAELEPNQQVTWNYTVTNTGTDSFESVTVTDDRGVRVDCPNVVDLEPGDSITCTGTGTVGYADNYVNVATATGVGVVTGETASDTDDWSATVRQQEVGIQIDKVGVGVAETDTVVKNLVVTWQYIVTNPGAEPIGKIVVTDDQGVVVSCPADELAPDASMVCTGSGSVGEGDTYHNIGAVTGTSTLTERDVSAEDPWSVVIRDLVPGLSIVKGASNAVDGGSILAGTTVNWNYTVQNTGEEHITNLMVVDSQGVEVSCPVTELAVHAITTCTGSATIGNVGTYTNIGRAIGEGVETGTTAEAEDTWSTDVEAPETSTVIAKNSTEFEYGSTLVHGQEVSWEYEVTNTGSEHLVNIVVTDDMGVEVTCPAEALAPGESMICHGTGTVGDGEEYTNIGTIAATGEISGVETSGDDTWTVALVRSTTDVNTPVVVTWPDAPVGGEPSNPSSSLPITGGVALGSLGTVGLAGLLVGLGILLATRRKITS